MNVTGTRDPAVLRREHVDDALTLLPFLPPEARAAVDVGSGGGLPGIPLAIARPDVAWTLLDATGRKTAFLEATARGLDLANVTVVTARAEEAGRDEALRAASDVATCRAVGALREVLEYVLPFLRVGGVALLPKARTADEEVAAAANALETLGADAPEIHPTGHGDRVVVVVRKTRETPDRYPRRPGRARKAPL